MLSLQDYLFFDYEIAELEGAAAWVGILFFCVKAVPDNNSKTSSEC